MSNTSQKPYHHGDLPSALLDAAEYILVTEGIEKLTLRAAARRAGVSHAAPKNHFDNITGLLSELAARGYEKFRDDIFAKLQTPEGQEEPLKMVGLGYVVFAKENAELFQLMFRNKKLDYERPALALASRRAFEIFSHSAIDSNQPQAFTNPTEDLATLVRSWSLVHGFAMLLLDGRLEMFLSMLPSDQDAISLLRTMMSFPE